MQPSEVEESLPFRWDLVSPDHLGYPPGARGGGAPGGLRAAAPPVASLWPVRWPVHPDSLGHGSAGSCPRCIAP